MISQSCTLIIDLVFCLENSRNWCVSGTRRFPSSTNLLFLTNITAIYVKILRITDTYLCFAYFPGKVLIFMVIHYFTDNVN